MPPVAVRTPSATSMPWMSSGTVSLRTSSTFLPCCAHSTAWSAVKTTWPDAAPGEAGRPFVASGSFFHSAGSKTGASSCESAAGSTSSSASFGERSFSLHEVGGDHDRRVPGALAVPRLQHVELLVLDRELEVLDVPVVLLEARRDLAQLLVGLRHHLLELGDRLRRADAGDDVFALGVDEELAEELLGAGRGIAREADARGRPVAGIAEHHLLHVDGRADVVRGSRRCGGRSSRAGSSTNGTPRRARRAAARTGSCGKVLPVSRLIERLVARDRLLQAVLVEVRVLLRAVRVLHRLELVLELVLAESRARRCRTSG